MHELFREMAGVPEYARLETCVSWSGSSTEVVVTEASDPGTTPIGTGPGLAELFCAAKPIVASSVLALAHAEGIDVTAPVRALVPTWPTELGSVSLRALLCHETNLVGPSGLEWMCTPIAARSALPVATSQGMAYSEVAGGWLTSEAWRAITGRFLAVDIAERVLTPLGLDERVVIDGAKAAALPADRIRIDLAPGRRGVVPLLHVLIPEYRSRTGTEFSGWASCEGMHAALRAIVDGLGPFNGVGRAILDGAGRAAFAGSSARLDSLLGKVVGFRAGFTVVDETEGLENRGVAGLLLICAGTAQKVSVLAPATGLVVSAWTNAALVNDASYLTFRDAVLTTAARLVEQRAVEVSG